MPIRRVKQRSERGNIKELTGEPEVPATAFELRAKQLFEYAQLNKDKNLQAGIGFITTDYIADKNALPLSVYRIRQVVADIKSRSGGTIDELSQEIEQSIRLFNAPEAQAYWNNKQARVKTASAHNPPFWRASKDK